jgi:dTDP-4-amino-4,6-dideoxygalactose transaminase
VVSLAAPRIPFNRVIPAGRELDYVAEAIANGYLAGDGIFSKRCEQLLSDELSVHRALLTPSCTAALEMAAHLLDISPGDEVIVPDFTFVSTINAFVLRGASPVFIDIRPDTLNLDERLLLQALTPRTKAIVVVHYAGVGCEMKEILQIAQAAGVAVVEDNAHGLFGSHRGQLLGTFGCLGTLSFHETKNFTCGEGGALLVNDPRLLARAEIIREKGTDRSRFFRGEVDKYTWVDLGSSQLPSELQAAFLLAQLEAAVAVQEQRQYIWRRYDSALRDWAGNNQVLQPEVPEHCEPSYHMFHLRLPTGESRDRFISHMSSNGIGTPFHYLPLHLSPMGRRVGRTSGDCSVTETVSARLVRLPLFRGMMDSEQDRVIDAVMQFAP